MFALGFLLASLLVGAQSKSDKMYDAFMNQDGVTQFGFSKNLQDVIHLDVGDDGNEKTVTGDLQRVRFMTYNPEKGAISGNEFTRKAVGYLPKGIYHRHSDNPDEDEVEIWLKGNRNRFSECHVFTKSEEPQGTRIVVSFYGDFRLNDLEALRETAAGME